MDKIITSKYFNEVFIIFLCLLKKSMLNANASGTRDTAWATARCGILSIIAAEYANAKDPNAEESWLNFNFRRRRYIENAAIRNVPKNMDGIANLNGNRNVSTKLGIKKKPNDSAITEYPKPVLLSHSGI